MAKQRNKNVVKRSGCGSFFIFCLGMFFGVIALIGTEIGVGYWAYKNINIAKLESYFDFEINLGNDPSNIKSMSIEELISLGVSVAGDIDNITLNDLYDDFGISIPDEIYNIDISSLKDISVVNLLDEGVSIILDEITVRSIVAILDIEDSLPDNDFIGNIIDMNLSDALDYILNLIDVENLTVEDLKTFGFDLSEIEFLSDIESIADGTATLSELNALIEEAVQNLTVSDLEKFDIYLTDISFIANIEGISDMSLSDLATEIENAIDEMTIADLNTNFGVNLLDIDFIANIEGIEDSTLDELVSKIDTALEGLSIADLSSFGITVSEIAVLKDLAPETLLSELGNEIDSLTIGELLNLDETETNALLLAISDFKIGTLSTNLQNLTIGEMIGVEDGATGILSALKDIKLGEMTEDNILSAVEDMTLAELLNIDDEATGILAAIKDYTLENLSDSIGNITISQITGITADDGGILGALANLTINGLDEDSIKSAIEDLTIAELMGLESATGILGIVSEYTISNFEDNIKTLTIGAITGVSAEDGGILGALASLTIDGLTEENIKTAIEGLSISDIFNIDGESGIFALIDVENTTVVGLPAAIANALNADTLTIADLLILDPTLEIPDSISEEWTLSDLFEAFDSLSQYVDEVNQA